MRPSTTALTLDPEYSINPLDLQPGLRQPIGSERSFLINFLSVLVTPIGEKSVPMELAELAGQVIDEAYQKYDDDPRYAGTPKLWSKGEDPKLDEMAARLGIPTILGITTWYDLVDEFHKLGRTEEAILAQRYAVPRLADLMAIVRTESIETVWKGAKLPSGEDLIMVFWRAIGTALREYPVFAAATRFSIGSARVISLDLQQVTGGSGDANDKRTSIMYMLGRFVLTRDRYVSDDTVTLASDIWVDWHRKRAQEVKETPCRFGMDEYHRASKAPSVQDQIILDMREGRKFGIQIILGSQIDTDFKPEMLDLVTFVYVFGGK